MGRPKKIRTPERFEKLADAYFKECKKTEEPVTMTGLAWALGFASRQSLYDYEKDKKFAYVVKRARLGVEAAYERRMMTHNPTGPIFALKQMGWSDRQTLEVGNKDGKPLKTEVVFVESDGDEDDG